LYFATEIVAGWCSKARDLAHWLNMESPEFCVELGSGTTFPLTRCAGRIT
jgi:hypothetical protein